MYSSYDCENLGLLIFRIIMTMHMINRSSVNYAISSPRILYDIEDSFVNDKNLDVFLYPDNPHGSIFELSQGKMFVQ